MHLSRALDTVACYERVICRGEAEPPHVFVRFTVQADGRIEDAAVVGVTEYCWNEGASVEVRGDPEGELALCLLEVVKTTQVALPASLGPFEVPNYPFGVESPGCSIHRLGGPCDDVRRRE